MSKLGQGSQLDKDEESHDVAALEWTGATWNGAVRAKRRRNGVEWRGDVMWGARSMGGKGGRVVAEWRSCGRCGVDGWGKGAERLEYLAL